MDILNGKKCKGWELGSYGYAVNLIRANARIEGIDRIRDLIGSEAPYTLVSPYEEHISQISSSSVSFDPAPFSGSIVNCCA